MSRDGKFLFQILRGTPDANISFNDLRRLLKSMGFEERSVAATIYFADLA